MAIEFTVDSIDTVDESLRGAYTEVEGKFNFDPDKYAEIKAQGLKSKNKELLGKLSKATESATAAKRFEKFAELADDDLESMIEWHANKDKTPDPNKGKGTDELQAQFDRSLKKAQEKFDSESTALKQENENLKRENKHYKLTVPLKDIASKAGVLPDYLDLVMMDTASRFTLDEDGKIVMLDKDGDPTDVEPQKFFSTLYKDDRPHLYAPSGASGSGAPSSTANAGGKKTMRRADFDKLQMSNPQQASAFLKEVSVGKAALIDN